MSTSTGKVLILTPDLSVSGGVANYFNVLALHERCDVEYFFVNSATSESRWQTLRRLVSRYAKFLSVLRKRRYRLIHVNPSLNMKSFLRDGTFTLLANLSRTPVLVLFHGWDDRFASRIKESYALRVFFANTFGRCRSYVVLGEVFKRRLMDLGIEEARIHVEVTVADSRKEYRTIVGAMEAKISAPRNEMNVLFMSRIVEEKGVLTAIDAVARCWRDENRQGIPLRLSIAGDGEYLDTCRSYAQGLDFVEFLGDVRGEKKWLALERAHVFLFPTRYGEGLPCVVLEAMVHGLPVLTRFAGALGEVVKDGVNGFITSSTDPDVFAQCLRRISEDQSLYRRIAANNLRDSARFMSDAVGARLVRNLR